MEKGKEILDIAPEECKGEISKEQEEVIKEYKEGFEWDVEQEKSDEDPKKKSEETPPEEDESKKSETEKPEEKPDDKPSEKEGEKKEGEEDQEKEKSPEEKEGEVLKKIAEEEGITVEEAKEIIGKDKSIVERHENDPLKIARALRKEQSEYGKIKSENEKLRQFKSEIEVKQFEFREDVFNQKCETNREKLIEVYLKGHPKEEDENEDVLFERTKVEAKNVMKEREAKNLEQVTQKADEKINNMVSELPEEFKEFVPEIKDLVKNINKNEILEENFDVIHIAHWARGKKYTPEYVESIIKDAEKRAKEEPKIKEKNTHPSSERGATKVSTTSLSEEEKSRAKEIYGDYGWPEDKVFSEYAKSHKDKDSWD